MMMMGGVGGVELLLQKKKKNVIQTNEVERKFHEYGLRGKKSSLLSLAASVTRVSGLLLTRLMAENRLNFDHISRSVNLHLGKMAPAERI